MLLVECRNRCATHGSGGWAEGSSEACTDGADEYDDEPHRNHGADELCTVRSAEESVGTGPSVGGAEDDPKHGGDRDGHLRLDQDELADLPSGRADDSEEPQLLTALRDRQRGHHNDSCRCDNPRRTDEPGKHGRELVELCLDIAVVDRVGHGLALQHPCEGGKPTENVVIKVTAMTRPTVARAVRRGERREFRAAMDGIMLWAVIVTRTRRTAGKSMGDAMTTPVKDRAPLATASRSASTAEAPSTKAMPIPTAPVAKNIVATVVRVRVRVRVRVPVRVASAGGSIDASSAHSGGIDRTSREPRRKATVLMTATRTPTGATAGGRTQPMCGSTDARS